MKTIILLILALLNLVSCDFADQAADAALASQNKSTSTLQSCDPGTRGCDMNWVIDFPVKDFPQNIEVSVNDRKIYTECNRDTHVTVTRNGNVSQIVIYNFLRLDGTNSVRLKVLNLGNCNEEKKTFYDSGAQRYRLNMGQDGSQYVYINLNV